MSEEESQLLASVSSGSNLALSPTLVARPTPILSKPTLYRNAASHPSQVASSQMRSIQAGGLNGGSVMLKPLDVPSNVVNTSSYSLVQLNENGVISLVPPNSLGLSDEGPPRKIINLEPRLSKGGFMSFPTNDEGQSAFNLDDSSSGTRDTTRRFSHNEVERKRRDKINEMIREMEKIVPEVGPNNSKAHILQRAVEYIRQLESDVTQLHSRVVATQSVNETLRSTLNHVITTGEIPADLSVEELSQEATGPLYNHALLRCSESADEDQHSGEMKVHPDCDSNVTPPLSGSENSNILSALLTRQRRTVHTDVSGLQFVRDNAGNLYSIVNSLSGTSSASHSANS